MSMSEKVFEKATEYIDSIAASLGVAAEHVYGIIVKQQIVAGIVGVAGGSLSVLIAVTTTVVLLKAYLDAETETIEGSWSNRTKPANWQAKIVDLGNGAGYVVLWILSVLAFVIGIAVILSDVKQLINPEYYAIREIMDVIGGGE